MDVDRSGLTGDNAAYLEGLEARARRDPESVDADWQRLLRELEAPPASPIAQGPQIVPWIEAYRLRGYIGADTDPLHLAPRQDPPELEPAFHGLSPARDAVVRGFEHLGRTLGEIQDALRRTYQGPIGYEFATLPAAQRRWLVARIEGDRSALEPARRLRRLDGLIASEALEQTLQRRYPGQKRFSLEGGDTLVPMLDEGLRHAIARGTRRVMLAMAHRGRLNVLVNLLGKPPAELFAEFEGQAPATGGPTGDVKYHLGYFARWQTPEGVVPVQLAFNPSHLEMIDPVLEGQARAWQDGLHDTRRREVLAVIVHGDAAFVGQGVVAETLNLSGLRGYATGGTLHVILDNQIGFSLSDKHDAHTSRSPADLARSIDAPIFHVNGDDPDAAARAMTLALDFRDAFQVDAFIDLVCWRRHGHNEADEPRATQPGMYRVIDQHPGVASRYAQVLVAEGLLSPRDLAERLERQRQALQAGTALRPDILGDHDPERMPAWRPGPPPSGDTRFALPRLQALAAKLCEVPPGFEPHRQIVRMLASRRAMAAGSQALDWGFAENLAYATILDEGHPVRLAGQDVGRGTFFQRHVVLHAMGDAPQGVEWIPLQHLDPEQAPFEVHDSPVTELAVLGFEYGYSVAAPHALVVWEAQYGDFVNAAQVIVDQFVAAAHSKWNQDSSLVMLLPHGQDGQGPDHSSARLERFLQLCAEDNMRVVVPSTPAQSFHALRRQCAVPPGRPLALFTPKSLLRHPRSVSTLNELAHGEFSEVIGESLDPRTARRVAVCSGKLYFELLAQREQRQPAAPGCALVRLEQLYPFPARALREELARYRDAEVVWVQEEPYNQGAWRAINEDLQACLASGQRLSAVARPPAASPAVGRSGPFQNDQASLLARALGETTGTSSPEAPSVRREP